MEIFILMIILCAGFSYGIFLILFSQKLNSLERKIEQLFHERNDLIPSIFEVCGQNIQKQEEIFEEILRLRKQAFNA